MKLSDKKIKHATREKDGLKLSDGGGLYVELSANGGKYLRYKYRFAGKERRISLGVYPETSLAEARERHRDMRKLLEQGIDPSHQRRMEKLERAAGSNKSFENIAREWHQQRHHTWKPEHAARIMKRLESDIFPAIGKRPINEIKPIELLAAIQKVEARGVNDTAHRLLQTCGQVFRYGVATARAERDITPDLQGALKPVKSKHMAYLKEHELPAFLCELQHYDQQYRGRIITKLGFQFLILTFVRSAEIRGATWEEIDWDKAEWRIPAERMKMKEQHIVPLSPQALEVLKRVASITGGTNSGYIFPGHHGHRKMLSENTFTRAIQIMGYKDRATGHGFRSTASTILNENGFRADVIERQLAHCERNQIRAAYNHAEYLSERREMMSWWGNYLESKGMKCHG